MNAFIRAIVRIFSFGERLIVPFNSAIDIFSTDIAISTNAGLRYPVTETPRAFKYCFKSEATFSQNDCAPNYYPCFDRILSFFTLPFLVFNK